MTYFTQVVEKEYFDSFSSSDEFIQADIELIKTYASENGMTFEECLQQMLKKECSPENLSDSCPGSSS